ncbi:hypothetical protein LCGC14_1985760, partial [marine sediment metagenome]
KDVDAPIARKFISALANLASAPIRVSTQALLWRSVLLKNPIPV